MHYLLVAFLLSTSSIQAMTSHEEVFSMKEVSEKIQQAAKEGHSPKRTLVVFDIDNTVLAQEDYLGSDQWFTWKSDQIRKTDPTLFTDLLNWQGVLFDRGLMRLTEKNTKRLIQVLQKKYPVIALTSRSPGYREATERELIRNGINFSKTSFGRSTPGKIIPKGQKRLVSYETGVFMTSGLHKGEMLNYLIRKSFKGQNPFTQIIFIDDHLKNTSRVYETFSKLGIEILSLRYGKEDHLVNKFKNSRGIKGHTTKQLKFLREALLKVFGNAPRMI